MERSLRRYGPTLSSGEAGWLCAYLMALDSPARVSQGAVKYSG